MLFGMVMLGTTHTHMHHHQHHHHHHHHHHYHHDSHHYHRRHHQQQHHNVDVVVVVVDVVVVVAAAAVAVVAVADFVVQTRLLCNHPMASTVTITLSSGRASPSHHSYILPAIRSNSSWTSVASQSFPIIVFTMLLRVWTKTTTWTHLEGSISSCGYSSGLNHQAASNAPKLASGSLNAGNHEPPTLIR